MLSTKLASGTICATTLAVSPTRVFQMADLSVFATAMWRSVNVHGPSVGSWATLSAMQSIVLENAIRDLMRQTVVVQINLHQAYRPVRQHRETAPS
jgi:hypothetical protein